MDEAMRTRREEGSRRLCEDDAVGRHRGRDVVEGSEASAIPYLFFFFFLSQLPCASGSKAPCSTSVYVYMRVCVFKYM